MDDQTALAKRVVEKMYSADEFSKWLGVEFVSVKPREIVLKMKVRPEMVNGFGVAHGGIVFAFADSALAFACNSTGEIKVSIDNSIAYPAPIKVGDVLTAAAAEQTSGNRVGMYEVTVTNQDGAKVALFRGVVYTSGKKHFE